ncbi:hypothetical protein HYE40_02890 [Mycoplasmopsis bovis]|nr:hypothetical protein HYE40_02890 [Mycoplasmopsis bovis]
MAINVLGKDLKKLKDLIRWQYRDKLIFKINFWLNIMITEVSIIKELFSVRLKWLRHWKVMNVDDLVNSWHIEKLNELYYSVLEITD